MGKLKTKLAEFDKETGRATYIYQYKGNTFIGEAQCHEDDMDMCSELVGLQFAETRAFLKFLKVRRDELIVKKETLEGLFNNLLSSKDFNPYSKYGLKIRQSICDVRTELYECREAIKGIPAQMKKDIEDRDKLYNILRKRRNGEGFTSRFISEPISAE